MTDENSSIEKIYDFSIDVLDKRYGAYNWCESKVNTLVTLNGLLMAALFVVINGILSKNNCLLLILSIATIVSLTVSLLLSVIHIVPKMNSGRTSGKNIRTIIGTENFHNNEDYFNAYMELKMKNMIQLNTEQIRGMNSNIMKGQKAIKRAAICTGCSVFFFLALVLTLSFTG